jgi:hypothetical protein
MRRGVSLHGQLRSLRSRAAWRSGHAALRPVKRVSQWRHVTSTVEYSPHQNRIQARSFVTRRRRAPWEYTLHSVQNKRQSSACLLHACTSSAVLESHQMSVCSRWTDGIHTLKAHQDRRSLTDVHTNVSACFRPTSVRPCRCDWDPTIRTIKEQQWRMI